MSKRFHTDKRTSENFTVKGLRTLTGVGVSSWLKYVTKEVIDNSLEATNGKPEIELNFSQTDYSCYVLSIKDNGPGIPEETIRKIFQDIDSFGGTKRHYKLVTRGNQGNALMTILGIQNLLAQPLKLQSNDDLYTVKVVENELSGVPEVRVETEKARENINGFCLTFASPYGLGADSIGIGDIEDVKDVYFKFVELNPHADFRLVEKIKTLDEDTDNEYFFKSNGYSEDNNLNLGKKITTGKVIWFSKEDFFDRLKADARVDPGIKIRDLVSEFYGLSSSSKVHEVISEFGLEHFERISDFFDDDGNMDKPAATKLYEAMWNNTKRFSDRGLNRTLGCLGEEGMKHALIESLKMSGRYEAVEKFVEASKKRELKIQSLDDMIVYQAKGGMVETDKVIPFYFELTKRYDIGLINSEGYANNATRDLIEKIQQVKPNLKLYVLTDFDIDGLGIAKNVKKADELSAFEAFECERLGITLEDVKDYGLPIEPVVYARNKLTELENRYQLGEISDDVYNFLKAGQRVEINALSPVELKSYLERKFQEAGIEKLKPETEDEVDVFETRAVEDIRKDALKEAIADFVSKQCDDIIMNFLDTKVKLEAEGKKTADRFIDLTDNQAKTIYDEIIEELKEFPPKNWYELNEDKKDKIRNEAESVEKKYKAAIKAQAEELLSETVCIDVKIGEGVVNPKSTKMMSTMCGYLS